MSRTARLVVRMDPASDMPVRIDPLLNLRNARLVDFTQDGVLRCYYLACPKLVCDMLRLMARDERPVKRTADQIKKEKVETASRYVGGCDDD